MTNQRPLLTVTLNPALDIGASVDRVLAGPKLRLSSPRIDPGGGGINVARVILRLDGAVTAFAALGGATGKRLSDRIRAEGLDLATFELPSETRESLTVLEETSGDEYRFVLPGPDWSEDQEAAAITAIAETTRPDALVVLSGSQPPGTGAGFPARLAAALADRKAELVVDTSGPALARLIGQPDPATAPAMLRLDQAEAEGVAGQPISGIAGISDLAGRLQASGAARLVILACGADGSVMAGPDGLRLHAAPPRVEVVSKVGAGDSFTGAFALALARGETCDRALVAGVAAAAAAVTTPGTELCRAEDVLALMPQVRLSAI